MEIPLNELYSRQSTKQVESIRSNLNEYFPICFGDRPKPTNEEKVFGTYKSPGVPPFFAKMADSGPKESSHLSVGELIKA